MDDFLHPTANPTGTLDVIVHIHMYMYVCQLLATPG